jgi:hypothetical protein
MESNMKKILLVAMASLAMAAFTTDAASARHHQRVHHRMSHNTTSGTTSGMTTGSGMGANGGSNAELKGNNGNSASGSNSLTNPNNAANTH